MQLDRIGCLVPIWNVEDWLSWLVGEIKYWLTRDLLKWSRGLQRIARDLFIDLTRLLDLRLLVVLVNLSRLRQCFLYRWVCCWILVILAIRLLIV